MMEINSILKNISIEEISYEGYGVNRQFDKPIFVLNGITDEVVDVKIIQKGSKFYLAEIINFINKSLKRTEINNQELYKSGSASLMHLAYNEQLNFKNEIIEKLFKRNNNYEIKNRIISSISEWNYRNKITFQINIKSNKIECGFYEKCSHNIVVQKSLDLVIPSVQKVSESISRIFNTDNKEIIEWTKQINLQNITIQGSIYGSETFVVFNVLNDLNNKEIIDYVYKQTNDLNTNFVVSVVEKNLVVIKKSYIYRNSTIEHKFDNLIFKLDYNTFYQVNEAQMHNMFAWIKNKIKELNFTKNTLLDTYAGVGIIGMILSSEFKEVTSIEITKSALESFNKNKTLNNLNNIEMVIDNTHNFLKNTNKNFDLIVFDPPRNGLDNETIKLTAGKNVKNIVYVSCNPRTLSRDLIEFDKYGYVIQDVQTFDMFPQTPHIETVVIIQKRK